MAHLTVVDRWEEGKPTPISPDANNQSTYRRGISRPIFHDRERRRRCNDQSATLRRRYDCLHCVVLACLGPRAIVQAGEGSRNPNLSPQQEHGLGRHDLRDRVHYQLVHY